MMLLKGKMLILIFIMALLMLPLTCLQGDIVELSITWTAVGDDGLEGIAAQYDIRYAADSLTLINNWDACTIILNPPVPDTSGTCQQCLIINLQPNDQIYIAIKTVDEVGNWSEISNILSTITPAGNSPISITDLNLGICE